MTICLAERTGIPGVHSSGGVIGLRRTAITQGMLRDGSDMKDVRGVSEHRRSVISVGWEGSALVLCRACKHASET